MGDQFLEIIRQPLVVVVAGEWSSPARAVLNLARAIMSAAARVVAVVVYLNLYRTMAAARIIRRRAGEEIDLQFTTIQKPFSRLARCLFVMIFS